MSAGQEIEIKRFSGNGAARMLWLPSERGLNAEHSRLAAALARLGHEVWLADLHDAYFEQPGRNSIGLFPLDDIVEIIDAAAVSAPNGLILVSGSRGAQLALIGAREWQLRNPGKRSIKGVILAHAHLYDARPGPGQSAHYLPIVSATNLPVYLLAAQYSTKSSRIAELAAELGVGGSAVYTQVLPGVQGGFYLRDDAEISDRERTAKASYAATLSRAASVLKQLAPPPNALASDLDTRRFSQTKRSAPVLTAVNGSLTAPALKLPGFDGQPYALEDQAGSVVLVNFWASWCRPCVDEIPSLHRLAARFEDSAFAVVTVNVGEDRARIARFLQQVPVELPLLMDYDASIAKDWMIYVYPSSYLVDHQGKIRYAYLGALEWDSIENLEIIQSLLNQL
ncbi:MAG: TlpA family protein disulfide reductase [Gammaproteobacteria bacterium]|nr:TlpA family protein disulfide reductase [Gammaproteobacteria bacterium]